MKDQLTRIFNALKQVETKGDSTVIMADCLRAMATAIQEIEREESKNEDIKQTI